MVLAREDVYIVLDALERAIELAETVNRFADQIAFEDAYGIILDAALPDLPEI